MADIDKRLRYFNGQFLQDVDFNAEQAYHLDRQRRHNRVMHTYGIAEGLTVTSGQSTTVPVGSNSITVSPGTALDGQGRQIVLTQGDSRILQLNQPAFVSKTVLVVISYAEATSDTASVGGSGSGGSVGGSGGTTNKDTRWQERPNVQIFVDDANAPAADTYLRLARLTLNASGATTALPDLTQRISAGVKLGTDVPVQILRISNPNLAPALWPVFTATVQNRADLTGGLSVSGAATVAGAAALAGGATITGNASVSGTATLGAAVVTGAANLNGGATIAGNASVSGTATLGAATVTGAANLNGGAAITGNASVSGTATLGAAAVTGNATVGGTATVTGLVNGRNLASDGTKLDGHVAIIAGNPHGTLASQLTDYDYGKRTTVGASFGTGDGNGATRTLNVGFQTRFVWFTAGFNVYPSGGWYIGAPISGFADLRSGIIQSGIYLTSYRLASSPFQTVFQNTNSAGLGTQYFYDYTTTPNSNITNTVAITSVSSTGLVLTLSQSTTSGLTVPGFYIALLLVCVG